MPRIISCTGNDWPLGSKLKVPNQKTKTDLQLLILAFGLVATVSVQLCLSDNAS